MQEFTLSDLNRRPGELVDIAFREPILFTKHKRPQMVMMSATHYALLVGMTIEDMRATTGSVPRRVGLSGLKGTSTIDDGEDDLR